MPRERFNQGRPGIRRSSRCHRVWWCCSFRTRCRPPASGEPLVRRFFEDATLAGIVRASGVAGREPATKHYQPQWVAAQPARARWPLSHQALETMTRRIGTRVRVRQRLLVHPHERVAGNTASAARRPGSRWALDARVRTQARLRAGRFRLAPHERSVVLRAAADVSGPPAPANAVRPSTVPTCRRSCGRSRRRFRCTRTAAAERARRACVKGRHCWRLPLDSIWGAIGPRRPGAFRPAI